MVKRVIVRGLENHWSLAGNLGSIFYFVTDSGAPRRRIVTMDVASMTRQLRELVPQSEDVLEGAALLRVVLFAHYLVDVKNEFRRYDHKFAPLGHFPLPCLGPL